MSSSDMSDFSSILHAAEQLVGGTGESRNLPRVERSLGQVLEASQELHSRLAQDGSQDVQAHLLLGSKGVDLTEISQKLHSLSAQRTLEPLDPVADTDIQSFLRNEKENAILSVIEEVHRNSFKAVEESRWEHVLSEWRQEKTKLMGALIGPSQNWLDLNKSIAKHTIVPDTTPMSGQRSNLDNKEMAYAKEVTDYNKLVVQGAMRPNLVQKFTQVAEKFSDARVSNLWEILRYITSCPPLPRNEDPIKSRAEYETAIVQQAKKYLEDRYLGYMNSCVTQNLALAQRGGEPGTYSLVRAFVSLRVQSEMGNQQGLQDGEINGRPLWPMVYYCLRSGDYEAAQFCMEKSAGPGNEDFRQVLDERIRKPDQRIGSALENALRLHYRRHIRNATDPYKRAAYCVIGGCDVVEEHPQVSRTADDYLWLKLSFINQNDGQGGCITYSDLQKIILEDFGEAYYNAAEHPMLYAQVLLLSGQLEAALEFLSRSDRLRCHAVHAALALHELHMLGSPRNVQAPLLSADIEDPAPTRRLNLARLVMLYVKKFEVTDPAEAMQYFFFLRNLKHPSGENLFTICVSDLALEIRDYALIFGKLQTNGQKSRGLIDQFVMGTITTQDICRSVGEQLIKKGLLEDAIKVFELAEDHNKVLSLYCTMLSQVVHRPSRPDSIRNRLQIGAAEFKTRLENSEMLCDSGRLASFNNIQKMMKFFDAYHNGQHSAAMEILRGAALLPLTLTEVDARVQSFKELSSEVCRIIPDLLLAAMDIVYTQYTALKKEAKGSLDKINRDRQLDYYRDQAKSFTNFAGTVPYRMPGDTNQRLVQMEILMY